ncbi:hypothetical protein [Aromatoleum aromaticum]|uniref:hypothetical protein n=1 Tax=Aromatoleum aromaticum TaxID=551760 RepID=UPI001459535E|nr:hypothetical protein [Aromatoleum aromaticum]NMG54566.1 hypothetical protein [Aromatoleum aromaticum]
MQSLPGSFDFADAIGFLGFGARGSRIFHRVWKVFLIGTVMHERTRGVIGADWLLRPKAAIARSPNKLLSSFLTASGHLEL